MLKIIKSSESSLRLLASSEVSSLPIGTTFLGRIGLGDNRTLGIKTYAGIVDLIDPQKTWVGSPIIDEYQEVDVEVTIREIR